MLVLDQYCLYRTDFNSQLYIYTIGREQYKLEAHLKTT